MSITDELRSSVANYPFRDNRDFALFEAIADRIDAEHERAMADAELAAAPTEAQLEELGYIALPVDADGVPIRPGDELVIFETGDHVRAYDIELYDDGRWLICDDETMDSIHPDRLRHRAKTVEDVLREFAREIDADAYGITDAKVAEFAAKLRLAGEDA